MDQPWVFIVLFGLIFIVYATIIPKAKTVKGQDHPSIQEIEETIEHFMTELDEQNKALIQMLAETKRDYEIQTARLSAQVEGLEKQVSQQERDINRVDYTCAELHKKYNLQAKPVSMTDEQAPQTINGDLLEQYESSSALTMNLKSRYAELFHLYEQGKSIEFIAKKLNMNKGEINLIFQLAKQEDKLSAH